MPLPSPHTLAPLLAALVAAASLAGCMDSDGSAGEPKLRERPAHPVDVAVVREVALERRLEVPGTLEALRRVEIVNREDGQIVRLAVREGDRVEQGQELARLDDDLIRAELDKAVAERRRAEAYLRRLEQLLPGNVASDDEVAQARSELELARAEESLQRIRLARTRVTAPFDAVVAERLREAGDAVSAYTPLLTLVDTSVLTATVGVSELMLPRIGAGDPVAIRIDALAEAAHPGEVLRVHPTVDPRSRQGTVEVALNPVPAGARPGQLCRVRFTVEGGRGLAVPFTAVQRGSEGARVFRVEPDGRARRVPVVTGLRSGPDIQVLAGLDEGDRVVVRGLLGLSDGERVRVVGAAGAGAAP